MKNKMRKMRGFTLVELLIVIALIAILAVGVLATINPVEQRNKATDANTSNDAGEVLNAYERYYTTGSQYPWQSTDPSLTSNSAFGSVSNMVGFGLCSHSGTVGEGTISVTTTTICQTYKTPGALITSDELKNSFLEKGYGKKLQAGETIDITSETSFDRLLYVLKTDADDGNSIYVCYIPQANSNRNNTNRLKKLTFNATTGVPETISDVTAADFKANGSPADTFTFTTPATSLFKCVP